MHKPRPGSKILWLEVVGFATIIALSWANELGNLPRLLLGGDQQADWRESVIETVLVVGVAVPVLWLTRRMVVRLHHLEGLLRVCSWCRKLNHAGEWVPVEEYFRREFETRPTHAVCPTCFSKMTEGLEKE